MTRLCLQKDPSKRPTTTTLLKHNFFKKAKDGTALAQDLLYQIEDIGESVLTTDPHPGSGPLFAKGISIPGKTSSGSSAGKYVPGTTWVFDDESPARPALASDVDDFAQHFDQVTGGERYREEN